MNIFNILADTQDPILEWINSTGKWIFIGLAGAAFLTVLVLFFISLAKRRQGVMPQKAIQKPQTSERAEGILVAVGGRENVVSHQATGSRLSLVLQDYSLIKPEDLKKNGVESTIKMSNKIILVIKDDLSKLYKQMF